MFGWLFLASFICLSLFSYDSADPAWSFVGSVDQVTNGAGRTGAWIADALYTLFGYLAWMTPLVIFVKAVRVFRYRYITWYWQPWLAVIRIAGVILALSAGAALTSLHYHFLDANMPASSGGVIGMVLVEQFLPAFNVTGSTLMFMAMFLTGFTLYTNISWFWVMDTTGRITLQLVKKLIELAALLRTKIVEYKERKVQETSKTERDRELVQDKMTQENKPPLLIAEKPAPAPVSQRVMKERQAPLFVEGAVGVLPAVGLLDEARPSAHGMSQETLDAMSRLLELKLKDFSVVAEVVAVHPGPVITRFEIQPAAGTKASKISNLASDLARSLAVVSVRVVEVIPGKSVMGIEIPNEDRDIVYFSEIIASKTYDDAQSPLSLALGHDIAGQPVVVDLAKMPHLLVAGTTGSGKSVGINGMLLSMLFKASPDEVRLIMIDPKMLELSIYDGIPHLLAPVVTDMKEAANSLRWCVAEMERRYKLMAHMGVRNIGGYNGKIKSAAQKGDPLSDPFYQPVSAEDVAPELEALPFIVVVVDEFADMMMIVGKKVEELIARIAQKARAAGIHLILATQRPSVDVITGLIKANVPTRISFQVSSKIDSRTIIDQGGAEQLLGHGDMLYLPPGTSVPIRVHGAFVGDDEVHRVVADWQKRGEPQFVGEILNGISESSSEGSAFSGGLDDSEQDPLYDEAVAFVTESRRASISSVQRKLKVGYNRAARMIEAMEAAGVVSPALSNGNREVIAPPPPRS
ncbi:cell division protein FtsK [Endozoicomonas sp. (ex Bugula neritina AB1)]|nr:cell division protein FtsK [Endozoicomonas sp. (ex Bugula neritina AB1)]